MYYFGVDLGGTNIKAGIVDDSGKIIHSDVCPTNAGRHYSEVIADIAELINKILKDSKADISEIKSIGVGVPGTCDTKNGVVICAANIDFESVPMVAEFKKYFDVPVYIGNDANCAALGEYESLDEDISNMVFITLGTGIGGGIILDKKLYIGTNGTAAEIGHMVIEKDGPECGCGARGCWETYASVTGLIRMTNEYAAENPDSEVAKACREGVSGKTAFDLAKKGDKGGKQIVDEWMLYLSMGIVNIINILQPEVLLIGGAISKEGDYLLNPILEYQLKNKYSEISDRTKIKIAKLGNDAGLIGSAFLGKGAV